MGYLENLAQRAIGPVSVYFKTYAVPGADPDWNSVSGFTKIFEVDLDSPVSMNFVEEFLKRNSASFLAPIGEDLVGQDFNASLSVEIVSLEHLARALGMTAADVTDKTATDPTRLQMIFGGQRTINWGNIIIRQPHPDILTKYIGFQILRAHIKPAGSIPLSIKEHQKMDIEIQAVCPVSGTHIGRLVVPYEEYGAVTPVIDTITPAGLSIGDYVFIAGEGFGDTQGDSVVTFSTDVDAVDYQFWTDNMIAVKIPATAITGDVTVTVNGVESSGVSYTIV